MVKTEIELDFPIMLKKLKNQLNRFMEDNKRDSEQYRSGWQQRVQDIYIHHYQRQAKAAHDQHPELSSKFEYKK